MSDITVCSGNGCPLANTCWRALAPRDYIYQSQFVTPPFKASPWKDGDWMPYACEYYWKYDAREEHKNEQDH